MMSDSRFFPLGTVGFIPLLLGSALLAAAALLRDLRAAISHRSAALRRRAAP